MTQCIPVSLSDVFCLNTDDSSPSDQAKIKRQPSKKPASVERKRFKIEMSISAPNKSAWQIKGVKILNGLLGFYIQKSVSAGASEQPYVRGLLSKLQRYPYFRLQEMGILFIGSRVDDNGEPIPGNMAYPESKWSLFIAKESDVGSIEEWLEAVCNRLNEDDIVNDKKIFAYSPVFTVSSYGTGIKPKLLENVVRADEILDMVIALHNLDEAQNRENDFENVDFSLYFADAEEAKKEMADHYSEL